MTHSKLTSVSYLVPWQIVPNNANSKLSTLGLGLYAWEMCLQNLKMIHVSRPKNNKRHLKRLYFKAYGLGSVPGLQMISIFDSSPDLVLMAAWCLLSILKSQLGLLGMAVGAN